MQHFCVSSRSYTIDRESSRQPPSEDKSRNREAVSDIALPFEVEDVAVKTVTAELVTPSGRKRVVVALGSAARNSYIDADLVKELGLAGPQAQTDDFVTFKLCPLGASRGHEIGAYIVENLARGVPVTDWLHASEKYPHLKRANPTKPHKDDKVSILVGADYPGLLTGREIIRGREAGEPMAELTELGWAFQGRTGTVGLIPPISMRNF